MEGATSLMITVTVNANPVPTNEETTWTMVDGVIGPDVQVTYNTITFTNIVRSIAGVYIVTSTTSAGTSTPLEITVTVLCKWQCVFVNLNMTQNQRGPAILENVCIIKLLGTSSCARWPSWRMCV